MNALVSIIIPLYNAEKYIAETITSSLNQTWPDKEIIIVDDGSTDNSFTIANAFKGEQVTIAQQENKGASAARNKGLSIAKGDYIQFLDADDLLKENKIEVQLNALKGRPGVMAYGSHAHFFDEESINECLPGCYLIADYTNGMALLFDLYGGNDPNHAGGFIPQHSWLIPRAVIEAAGNWNTDLTVDDDGEFFCRVILKSTAIIYTPNAIAYYRKYRHTHSLSAQNSYQAYLDAFLSIKLKQQHIGSLQQTNHLLANQAMHLLVKVYPQYPCLCNQLKKFISKMGGPSWLPYQEGPHKLMRILFGWKAVRLLTYYKNLKTNNAFKQA